MATYTCLPVTGPEQQWERHIIPGAALQRVKDGLNSLGIAYKQRGEQYTSRCPAHEDNVPSFGFRQGDKDCVLINCQALCDQGDILAALDMSKCDLFDGEKAEVARLPKPQATKVGREVPYRYTDAEGTLLFTKWRQNLSYGGKSFRCEPTGVVGKLERPPLYNLAALVNAPVDAAIYVVEGEKDVDRLIAMGEVATTNHDGGAGKWLDHYGTWFAGRTVKVIVDNDDVGFARGREIENGLTGVAASVSVYVGAVAELKADVSDHLDARFKLSDLVPVLLSQVDDRPGISDIRARFPTLKWEELWATEGEPIEWIVEPLIPARRQVVLYSAPGFGKSLISLECAAGVASGRSVLGYPAQPPRHVLYVDFENDPRGDIRERLISMGYVPSDLEFLHLVSLPSEMADLDTVTGGRELLQLAQAHKADLVVIDTVSRAVGGEENSNDTWLAFYNRTGMLLKGAGIALLRLDHAGKDDSRGQRGGSAKLGDVDLVWHLTEVEKGSVYRIKNTKHRMPIAEDELILQRGHDDRGRLRHQVAANPIPDAQEADQRSAREHLDRLGVPIDIGRDRVREEYLKPAGIKIGNSTLAAVLTERKRSSELSPPVRADGADSATPLSGPVLDCPGTAQCGDGTVRPVPPVSVGQGTGQGEGAVNPATVLPFPASKGAEQGHPPS